MPLTRHQAADLARARRVTNDPHAHEFERDDALALIARLEALTKPSPPPTCKWCLSAAHRADDAPCPVLSRFRLKHGRGAMPTDGQAADIRSKIEADAKAKEVSQRRADARERQTKLF